MGGSRNAVNEEQLDGISNILPENNVGNTTAAYTPIVDSVQEFSVQTNALSAEYGRFGGGVINLVTKSGTNAPHGSVFDFERNGVLNANDFSRTGPANRSPTLRFTNMAGPSAVRSTFRDFITVRTARFSFSAFKGLTRWWQATSPIPSRLRLNAMAISPAGQHCVRPANGNAGAKRHLRAQSFSGQHDPLGSL